jgi:hypothetical protein
MESERERVAALGAWPQARLGRTQPPRTPEKALVVDRKKKILEIDFSFKCVYFFLPAHCWGVSPKDGTVFFLHTDRLKELTSL